jgi:poly-gamma-glutamate system protein
LSIDLESDRHGTGLIGEAYTGLTSTQGSLPAKRSSATPDAAALLVALLQEAGVGEGSRVAVSASGSFPGFALAAVSACGALGADAVIILSIGSSSWGANRPEYTILDMFMAAVDAGAWPPGYPAAIAALSPGGSDDRGLDLDPGILEPVLARAEALGIRVLRPLSLGEAVSARMSLFRAKGEPEVLLTIGGNYAATGADPALALLSGVIRPEEAGRLGSIGAEGLVQEFLRAGRPVIQVLNIEALSTGYGLDFDPLMVPAIGKAGVYRRGTIRNLGLGMRLGLMVLILLPALGALAALARYRKHSLIAGI